MSSDPTDRAWSRATVPAGSDVHAVAMKSTAMQATRWWGGVKRPIGRIMSE